MFKRLVSAIKSNNSRRHVDAPQRQRRGVAMENLEGRQLFAFNVTSVIADNRGQVLIGLNPDGSTVNPATINKTSAILYTAGPDGLLKTADDVRIKEAVYWTAAANRITMVAKIKPGTGYRIRLVASRIKTIAGTMLDGDYTGTFPTGNGNPGGDMNVQTKNDKSVQPIVRMNSSLGTIVFKTRLDKMPSTVKWFISNANNGKYDQITFTDSEQGVIKTVSAGVLQIDSENKFLVTPLGEGHTPETTGLSNTIGTIAMERVPIDDTKEGNGFYFNLSNNTNKDAKFDTFGTVTHGLSVLQAINALTAIDLTSQQSFVLTSTDQYPVKNAAQAETKFDPTRDSVVIRRTAVQMRIAAV